MSNYTKITDFAVKDTLLITDPAKIIAGTDINNEFVAISTAIATKSDTTHSYSAKTSVVDADEVAITDSASGYGNSRITWANFKAGIKTYMDTFKDVTGGYVGMTLFKINFKNAADTFTSYFTNTNTASRTYTFPDKSGTVAMTDDAKLVSGGLPTITATVGSNALTIGMSAGTIDFHSATASDGTITTVVFSAPSNLVVSSGSTLGTVSAKASRLMVLAINNAGTVELAVVNESSGLDLSEIGVISTTAEGGAGGADSISTIYSTTARSNVAYRLIGIIESTQTTAGTWATSPSAIYSAGTKGMPIRWYSQTNATTSGSTSDFTIPLWTKRIIVSLRGISMAAQINSAGLNIQIGSGSVETSGYTGNIVTTSSTTTVAWSTSAIIGIGVGGGAGAPGLSAANILHGSVYLNLVEPSTSTWNISANSASSADAGSHASGIKAISGVLSILRVLPASSSFDAGSVTVICEG